MQRRFRLTQRDFKVMGSDRRMQILKLLDTADMTITDIAFALGMGKSFPYKCMIDLIDVSFVRKVDGNRKWIYYQITDRGRLLLHPENVTFIIEV